MYERGHEQEDVYQLAEQHDDWDERTIVWRFQHLKTVERIIGGNVIGTQGTPVDVLGKRIDVRFFPDLWLVRDEITRRSALGHGRPRGADRFGNPIRLRTRGRYPISPPSLPFLGYFLSGNGPGLRSNAIFGGPGDPPLSAPGCFARRNSARLLDSQGSVL